MGEIEAKVDGYAETVEAIVFAKEEHGRHQAKEEVSDPTLEAVYTKGVSASIPVRMRLVRHLPTG